MDAHWIGKLELKSSFMSECDAVESLWLYAREELQRYRVTRLLRSNDLPPARASEFELRVEMGKARAWRNGFLIGLSHGGLPSTDPAMDRARRSKPTGRPWADWAE